MAVLNETTIPANERGAHCKYNAKNLNAQKKKERITDVSPTRKGNNVMETNGTDELKDRTN